MLARKVGAIVFAEIPDTSVGTESRDGVDHLRVMYKCPCGDVSQLLIGIEEASESEGVAREHADAIKDKLRRHVIGEGNTPNF